MSALPQPPWPDPESKRRPIEAPALRRGRRRWLRVAGWTLAGLGVLVVLALLVAIFLLHNAKFHAYMKGVIQQKATASLGNPVEFRDFKLHFSGLNPSVEFYGPRVYGANPYPNPPLLEANRLYVGLTISSLWRRSWYVNDLQLENPVVHVFVDSQGTTNLPAPKSTSGQQTSVFDLGIRHLLLSNGQIYYNNVKSEMSADIQRLVFQSRFQPALSRYSGTLTYGDGHIRLQDGSMLPHSLEAKFSATRQGLAIENAVLTSGRSRLSLQGELTDYTQPKVKATYLAQLDASELRRAMHRSDLPEGDLQLSGSLNYAARAGRPLLENVAVNGQLGSKVLLAALRGNRVQIRDLHAQYVLSNGDGAVTGLRANLLGGTLTGEYHVRDLQGASRSQLTAALRGVSVRELQQVLAPEAAKHAVLQGSASASAKAGWGKTMQDLTAHVDATLASSLSPPHGGSATPVDGVFHADYRAANQQLSLSQSHLRLPATYADLNGTIGNRSELQVQIQSTQLHELENLAAAFESPGSTPLGIYGRGQVRATVTGSMSAPKVSGQVTAQDLRVRDSAWKGLRASFQADRSQVRIADAQLDPASQGHIRFGLTTGLTNWAPDKSSPVNLRLSATSVNVGDLEKLTGKSVPVTGNLSAEATVGGTWSAPAGHGDVRLTQARISEEPVRSADLKFQGDGRQLNGELALILASAGSANLKFEYEPAQQGYTVDLRTSDIKLEQLETVKQRDLGMSGVLTARATGHGTLQDPELQLAVEIPSLRVRDQVMQGVKFSSSVANHKADFNLDSRVLQTSLHGQGEVQLSGDYQADAMLDSQTIPLAPLLAIYAPAQAANLNGETEVHATLRGPLKRKQEIEAHITVPRLTLDYRNTIHLAAAQPIRVDYAKGVMNLLPAAIRGTGTELTMQARVPMDRSAPASLLLRGGVDLQLAQLINPDITSGGQLQFDIDSFGSRADPNVQGHIRIVNASFATADVPIGLQQGNGVLTLTQNRLNIDQFKAKMGGGDVTASGGVEYRPNLRFDVAMAAQNARVLYAQSVRTTLGSKLALTGNLDNALLQGQVQIEQISFTEDFDMAELMSQFGGDAITPPMQGFSQNLRLQIGISTPSGMNVSSRTLSLAGSANLRVQGTAAQPVMLGRMTFTSGDLIFSGNRFILQGGTLDFRNPLRNEPVVDVAANTNIDQYNIQMHFWGPADHLHTNYSSDPALPPADVINLIAFGKTSEAAAANPTPPGTLGAQSVIASQVSNQITNRIEKLAGISQLSIDPSLGDSQQSSGARLAIQQRVSGKIFFTFSTDVTSTQRQVIKFEYQLNRRTSLEAVRDQNGGISFQTSFRKRW